MQDAKVRAALLVICLVCLFGSGIVLFAGRHAELPPVVITPPPAGNPSAPAPLTDTPAATSKPPARVYVDVAGAVRRPSLYVLPSGSRVMQAILAAGGPTPQADMDAVNLAQKVTDEQKIFVPARGLPSPPSVISPALSPASAPPLTVSRPRGKAAKGSRTGRFNKITAESGEQIDLNTATAEQLQRLPGIGPSMADRILVYRTQAGGFGKIDDLMQVTGLGPKKFAKIAPFVKLD